MRLSRMLALGAIAAGADAARARSGGGSKPTIKIGSVGFDEARVMAEIYAQALEAKGYTVDRAGIGLGDASSRRAGPRERPDRPPAGVHRQRARRTTAGTPTGDAAANLTALQAAADGQEPARS